MTSITSPHNRHLKQLKRLHTKRGRALAGRFSAEGEDLIAAAEQAGRPALEGYRLAGTRIGGRRFVDVEGPALAAVSTLGSGTRAIAVYEQRWLAEPAGPLCVYLHGLRDPGNIGTVLRGANAFGASCVALGPGCADPHAPKAVRASMGAIFAVGLARARTVAELPGVRVALVAGSGEPFAEVCARIERTTPGSAIDASPGPGASPSPDASPSLGPGAGVDGLTLLVGAERDGLPAEVVAECEHVAHIPIRGESLNAAMAATVALYEASGSSIGVRPTSTRVRPA
jgi:RNA methyltransferase, TrmH family